MVVAIFLVVSIFLSLFTVLSNLVSASGGSIALANYYPEDGATYVVVDHFTYQITAVNTNTTVSVSIDNGPLIPMVFQGITNEVVNSDTGTGDWYTWQATIPAITNPGNYTFQFFSHYYVWQDQDQYWAKFSYCSTIKSFTIAGPFSTSPTSTPTITPKVPQLQPVSELQPWIILPLFAVTILASTIFMRKRLLKK